MSKKILINAVSSKMGGALTYLINLINELENIDSKNQYLVCVVPEIANQIKSERIKIISVSKTNSSLRRLWWDQKTMRKIIKKEKADILFSIANFGMLFCPVKQLLLIRNYVLPMPYLRKTVLSEYSFKKKILFILQQILMCFSAWSSDLVMFPSENMVKMFKKMCPISKSKLVFNHYGTYLNKFKKEIKKELSEPINLVYATMYGQRKNLVTVFNALKQLKDQGVKIRLSITIDSKDSLEKTNSKFKKDMRLINELGIENMINFLGKVPYQKIQKVYHEADIFVWATLMESFGNPMIEAMASGLPIIASDIPINKELGKDSVLYFSPFDSNDLVDKIKMVINDKDFRIKLATKAEKRAEFFQWQDHVKRLISIFESI